jgi:hypothetical protein
VEVHEEATAEQPSEPAEGKTNARTRWWWAALVISVLPVVPVVLSLQADGWRVCEGAPSQVGTTPLVTVCRPVAAPDLLILLLPIGVLLFPEVAELTIPGVISLKRKIARQEDEQRQLKQDLTRVQQQVSQQVINVVNVDYDAFLEKVARFIRKEPSP